MEAVRAITYAHNGNIYSLCLAGSYVWSGGTDRSLRVWSASGLHEVLGGYIDASAQGLAELVAQLRRQEEKIAQSEAYVKRSEEEASSLRLKLKAQAAEAMKMKNEMDLLSQENASVDQWQEKMQMLMV